MSSERSSTGLPHRAPSARQSALKVLLAIEKAGTLPDEQFDHVARRDNLDPRERGLMVELVRGVLRYRGTIDWRLGLVSDRPVRKLPSLVQMVLRLGAYQLLYLDRVPESAAVNESVRMMKAQTGRVGRDWSGFVNAVLRAVLRAPKPDWPATDENPVQAWSVRYSCPSWLVERWCRLWEPARAEQLCRASVEVPPLTLRTNTLRTTRTALLERFAAAQIEAVPTVVSPIGIQLSQARSVSDLPGYEEGWFYVEDEAGQLIPPLLDVQPGERVLDACAAPGGKTTHLAALMENRGQIVAVDRAGPRLELVGDNARRLGVTIVNPIAADLRTLDPRSRAGQSGQFDQSFDRILLDAPCSGLGVLRRHPEGKWYKSEQTIAQHAQLQSELLTAAWRLLRPGGVLVYSTCSIEPDETESVIDRFCQTHRDVQCDSVAPWVPPAAVSFVTSRGDLSTMTNPYKMDAFYTARLRRVA